jgi:hypothetical protein
VLPCNFEIESVEKRDHDAMFHVVRVNNVSSLTSHSITFVANKEHQQTSSSLIIYDCSKPRDDTKGCIDVSTERGERKRERETREATERQERGGQRVT